MEAWKERLYARYVSTGQAMVASVTPECFDLSRHGQLIATLRGVLPDRRDVRIVDVACGHGLLLQCANALGYTQLHGCDVSAEQVSLAHRMGMEQVVCQDLAGFLSERQAAFDIVFAMDVLEHLTKAELLDCLDMIGRALVPGGQVVIHVPNAEGLFGMRVRYGDLTHETAFTEFSMAQLLRATGFENIRCEEERPHVHGLKSAVRRGLWHVLTAPSRLLLAAETGQFGHLLSQNMLVTAGKPK